MEHDFNSFTGFGSFVNFDGTQQDFDTLMENETIEIRKKLHEMKHRNDQTIEEKTEIAKKKFKRMQNLYEEYDPSKFETKTRIDLLFFEHLCQSLPDVTNLKYLIADYYKTAKSLYEMVNMKPENHKMLGTGILVESFDDQQKTFSKIISEHINNHYYRLNPKVRKERFLNESKEYASYLIEKGLDSDEAIGLAVKACLMETLIRNIAIPKSIQKRIAFLCEDKDYGLVFDQDHLKELWESFNTQSKTMAKIFAAAV